MASIAMLVGGAVVNALAFSGSNYMFSLLRNSGVEGERIRHDIAVEQLQAAQTKWSQKRTERLDFINDELRRQSHANHTFEDVEAAMREYNIVTGKTLTMEPEPTLSNFYVPSEDQKNREIMFIVLGLGATALVAYQLAN